MDTTAMQPPVAALSFVSPIGYSLSSSCGYCTSSGRTNAGANKSYSYYAAAASLTPTFYKSLLDRTWRRSGKILYRPDPRRSCCPHYTVRVNSAEFRPTRDQRQAVNRFNKYVVGEDYAREAARLYPRSRAETKKRDNEFDLIERVHETEASSLRAPPQPDHNFTVTLEDDSFTEEKYKVFENYQRIVHKEEPHQISTRGFTRFLCESPIERSVAVGEDGQQCHLGSFHQCYRLDGVLVAVAVLDLLPSAVSSVYFFYHESIHKFSPGKLGALREIAMAQEDGYEWWYPGFYIPRCPKMRYKADYAPQYILDPESLSWDPLDSELLKLMDEKHYVSVSREKDATARSGDEASRQETLQDAPQTDGQMEIDDDCESLWTKNMPGVASMEHLSSVNLDHILIHLGDREVRYETCDLRAWQDQGIDEWPFFKTKIAQFVAALGTDLKDQICIDLRYGL